MGFAILHRQFNYYNRIIMLSAGGGEKSTIPSTVMVMFFVFVDDHVTVGGIMKYKKGLYLLFVFSFVFGMINIPYKEASGAETETALIAKIVIDQCPNLLDTACVMRSVGEYLDTNNVAVAVQTFPELKEKLIKIKTIDPLTNKAIYIVLSDNGNVLADNGKQFEEKARIRWINKFGKITPKLLSIMRTSSKDERIPVGIWLKMHYSPQKINKKSQTTNKVDDELENLTKQARERFIEQASTKIVSIRSLLQPYLGAPAMRGKLTVRQIQAISRLSTIANIYYAPEPSQTSACDNSWTWVQTARSDLVEQYYGYNGSGETICIITPCYPDDYTYLRSAGTYYTGSGACSHPHPKFVSATIANTYPNEPQGIAEGATSYFANWAGTPHGNISDPIYNGCRANNYYIWNFSHTSSHFDDRYFDYWAKHWPYPLITIAAGNSGSCNLYGGKGDGVTACSYNTMIVNASQDANTTTRSDDTLPSSCSTWYGCWRNPCPDSEWCPHGDRELPLITATGHQLRMLGTFVSGTSFATPTIAGVAALIHQENSNLTVWPEAVRAILMATASNDVDGTFFDPDNENIDEKDGAGEVNAYMAVYLAAPGAFRSPGSNPVADGYGYGSIKFSSDCPDGLCSEKIYTIQGNSKGLPVRVVLSFDATATCSDESSEASCANDHLDGDLDLIIRDTSTNEIVASSISWDNPVEVVQFTPINDQHNYNIEIWKASNTESYTYYGVAWYTANFVDNQ